MNKKPVPCLFIPREPNRFIRTSLVRVWSTLSCFLDRLITGSLCVRCRSSGCVFSFWLMMYHVFLAFRFRVLEELDQSNASEAVGWSKIQHVLGPLTMPKTLRKFYKILWMLLIMFAFFFFVMFLYQKWTKNNVLCFGFVSWILGKELMRMCINLIPILDTCFWIVICEVVMNLPLCLICSH
jgi:hypothetical protein